MLLIIFQQKNQSFEKKSEVDCYRRPF